MSLQNESPFSRTAFFRIFFRWRIEGTAAFTFLLPLFLLIAAVLPLQYESQVIVERKPAPFAFHSSNIEFDMTRFTSETQRNVSILRSRYMLNQWAEALYGKEIQGREREKIIARLKKHLA